MNTFLAELAALMERHQVNLDVHHPPDSAPSILALRHGESVVLGSYVGSECVRLAAKDYVAHRQPDWRG